MKGLLLSLLLLSGCMTSPASQNPENLSLATFAGGCFWCMEGPFEATPGVFEAISGYAGGDEKDPSYEAVANGQTSHREAVQVHFDPTQVSYEALLDIYWRQIDPTDPGGQFADRGHHYTTAIFYHSDQQASLAKISSAALASSDQYENPIVTKILPFTTFYPAEEYHQNFYKKNKAHYQKYKKGSGRADYIEALKDTNLTPTPMTTPSDSPFSSFTKPSDDDLRSTLTPLQYKVTQKEGTEKPFENPYWDNKAQGIYVDIISGEPLYSSTHKYKSGTGWPSFYQAIDDQYLIEKEDRRLFSTRTELRSRYGDSHLGHVFPDGPAPTGTRHCINSAALRFVPKEEMEKEGYGEYLSLFGGEDKR